MAIQPAGSGVFDDNEIFLQYIRGKDRVLMLYDGADLDVLEKVLPEVTAHDVHVLVTTRTSGDHPVLARANRITSLGRLGPDAGVQALQAWRGCPGKELDEIELMLARSMVSESPVEGLPIAIAHMATLMKMARVNCQQYYQLFKDQQAELKALALDMNKLLSYFRITNLSEPLLRRGMSQPSDLARLGDEDIQTIAKQRNERYLLSLARYFVANSNHVHLSWQLDIETVKKKDSQAMRLLLYASLMACRNIFLNISCNN